MTYQNGNFWSHFSMRFFEKVCVGAKFDVLYLNQGSRFFNSVKCPCKRINRTFRVTKNLMIWPRTYPCIKKIAWFGLSLWSDVKYQSRCSLWFSSKSETGSWKLQNILITYTSFWILFTNHIEIPNLKNLAKRSSFSLDTYIFLGVQFFLGHPVFGHGITHVTHN